ncbi:MAG: hypothetical protein K8S21_04875 [Gemmatimonadetes bacterium]|nr:hypothetical protein [Gemmatimonadota bacterium]
MTPIALHHPPAVVAPALAAVACAGELVTRIDVQRFTPTLRQTVERATDPGDSVVATESDEFHTAPILAYVRLTKGAPCTERERRESERMLRLQPFIASAKVTAFSDGPGRVRIRVDVVGEFAWVVSGRVSATHVDVLRFGTLDYRGRGLSAVALVERGGVYRPGVGVSLAQYGVLGRPAVATLQLERRPLGGLAVGGISQLFLTDVQRYAAQAEFTHEVAYATLLRPVGDKGAVRLRRSAYDVGWVRRLGRYRPERGLGLVGLMFLGADVRTDDQVRIVSDSGLIATGDTVLAGRYQDYGVSRVAVLGGLRALRFERVERYDALRAAQDVASGVQLGVLLAPSLFQARRTRDMLVAGDLYVGMGHARSFASLSMRAEARPALRAAGPWEGVVASSRLSWHIIASEKRTRVISLSAASMHRLVFPAQLSLRDEDGGLIGFPGSRAAGGQRAVIRVEERMLTPWFPRRADVAIAAFVDAGRLWAGDAPYGADSPVRSSAGFSLLGAFPSGGKRVYRVDIGFPVNPEPGGSGIALRFSVADRTAVAWAEPRDVAHARSGSGRASLMRW